MKSNIEILMQKGRSATLLSLVVAMLLPACFPRVEQDASELSYIGDQLVLYGNLTPDVIRVRISRTLPPGERYFLDDLEVNSTVEVTLRSFDGTIEANLAFDAGSGDYIFLGPIPTEKSYQITAKWKDLPVATSAELRFPGRPPQAVVAYGVADPDFPLETPFNLRTVSEEIYFAVLEPLVADAPGLRRSQSSLFMDNTRAYLDQCGIGFEMTPLVFTNRCAATDTFLLEGSFLLSQLDIDGSFVTAGTPDSIGIKVSAISEADHSFFLSLRRNQNVLEDYLLTEPISQSAIIDGLGYIYVTNGVEIWNR